MKIDRSTVCWPSRVFLAWRYNGKLPRKILVFVRLGEQRRSWRWRWIRFMYPYVLLESWIICYSSNITCAKSFPSPCSHAHDAMLDFRVFVSFLRLRRGRGSSEWWKDGKISFSHRLLFIVCVAAVMKSTNPSSERFPTLRLISINTIN